MSTLNITRPECPGCKFCNQHAYSLKKPYCAYPGGIIVEKDKCILKRAK